MIFDADTLERLAVLDVVPYDHRWGVSANHDGSRILVSSKQEIRVYDDAGNLVRTVWEIPEDTLDGWMRPKGALSPDGRLVAIGYVQPDWKTYRHKELFSVVDVDTGEVVFDERGLNPVFSPDGSRLAVQWDGKVMIYDTTTWEKVTYLSLWMMSYDSNWEFSPDGEMMAIASPERVEVWDIASRRLRRSIEVQSPLSGAPLLRNPPFEPPL